MNNYEEYFITANILGVLNRSKKDCISLFERECNTFFNPECRKLLAREAREGDENKQQTHRFVNGRVHSENVGKNSGKIAG